MYKSVNNTNSSIIDSIPAGIAVFHMDTITGQVQLLMINDSLADYLHCGRKKEEGKDSDMTLTKEDLFQLLEQNPYVFVHEKDVCECKKKVNELKNKDFLNHTFRSAKLHNEGYRWVHFDCKAKKIDDKNKILYFTFSDITEQKECEESILSGVIVDLKDMYNAQMELKRSERRYEFAMSYSDYFVWEYNISERLFIGSKRIKEKFDLGVEEREHCIEKMFAKGIVDESSAKELANAHKKMRDGAKEVSCRIKLQDKGFHEKFYKIMYKVISDVDDYPQIAVGISKDVTEEINLINCVHELISANSFEDSIQSVLRCVLNYYDARRAYICEFDWTNETVSRHYEECAKGVNSAMSYLQNKEIDSCESMIQAFQHGKAVYTEQNRKSIPIYKGDVLRGYLGIDSPMENMDEEDFFMNLNYFISVELEKNDMKNTLEYVGYFDVLTNVHNRNYYNRYLDERNNRKLINTGIIFVDMNGLKHINDTLGHTYGDDAIVQLAEVMKAHYHEDKIFRISGDEFVIIDEGIDYDEFEKKVASLREAMVINKEEIGSCGCYWENNMEDLKQGVYKAEQLMYIEKQRYYAEHATQISKKSPRFLNQLLEDIDKERYMVFLQPKAEIYNRKISGAEALIRKVGNDGRVISPYEFVPLLEQECLISKIDFLVLNEICKTMKRWEIEGKRLIKISVNMSRVTIAESDFIQKILAICNAYNIKREYLEFEITESSESMDNRKLTMIIGRLKEEGFSISLDDMGTEYSCLKMLPIKGIDTVKLDRSFITQINKREGYVLIKHVIEMCHDLGQKCIAEGVESDEQRIMLKEIGCDYYQGYLLDKPVAIAVFEKYL